MKWAMALLMMQLHSDYDSKYKLIGMTTPEAHVAAKLACVGIKDKHCQDAFLSGVIWAQSTKGTPPLNIKHK